MENTECPLTVHFLKGEKPFCEKCRMTNYKTPFGEAYFCWKFGLFIANMAGCEEWVVQSNWTAERFIKATLQPSGPKPEKKIFSDN